jgi:hypothetical protein
VVRFDQSLVPSIPTRGAQQRRTALPWQGLQFEWQWRTVVINVKQRRVRRCSRRRARCCLLAATACARLVGCLRCLVLLRRIDRTRHRLQRITRCSAMRHR